MAMALWHFGFWPPGWFPAWHWSGSGGYLAYAGPGDDVADVDFSLPIGSTDAGVSTIHIDAARFDPDVAYAVAIRAVSDSGIEEAGTDCWYRITLSEDNQVVGDSPNAVVSASLRPAAGGRVRLSFFYSRVGERGLAAQVQVCRVIGGSPDWDAVLMEIALRGGTSTPYDAVLADVYEHEELVQLCLRAVAADGATGPEHVTNEVAADSVGPEAVTDLSLEQL